MRSDDALPILRRLHPRHLPHYADADSRYGRAAYAEIYLGAEMSEGSVINRSQEEWDRVVKEAWEPVEKSTEKWSRVIRALAVLYQRYYTEGDNSEMGGVLLDELMQAYDEWLD